MLSVNSSKVRESEYMLEKELRDLKEKKNKSKKKAYSNIFFEENELSISPIENVMFFFGIKAKLKSSDFEKQLLEIKNDYNINLRRITLEENWHKNGILPMVIYKDGVPKAAIPDFLGRYYIYEKGRKRKIVSADNIDDSAYCFYRSFEKSHISRSDLIKFMLKSVNKLNYILLFAATALFMIIYALIPRIQYYIFNNVIPSGTTADISPIAYLLTGVVIVLFSVNIFKGTIAASIPHCINAHMQGAILSRLLMLKTEFFSGQKSGKLSSAIANISDISDIFSEETISNFVFFLLCLFYAYQIYLYTPEFMGYVYITFFVVIILNIYNSVLLRKFENRFYKKSDEMSGFVYELMGGMENIKLSGRTDVMFERWSEFYGRCLEAMKKPVFYKYYNAINSFIMSLIMVFIYFTGQDKETSSVDFIAFITIYSIFTASAGGIGSLLTASARFNAAYNRLKDFFMADVEIYVGKKEIDKINEEIKFKDVSFRYFDAQKDVLKNIDFSVKKGSKTGITGKSGCGKSTLLKLLLGFMQPNMGHIIVDNRDLNEIDLRSYRKSIGVVLQNSGLIPSDIYGNITLTSENCTNEDIEKALEAVCLKDDIDKLPMGLSTFVSNDNLTISGGQKQRILLARAILSKPSVLVLDEATNSLDNVTQAAFTEYIFNSDMTAIMIAHRISTIKKCDNIIFLDNGRISESGTYDQLMEKKGGFYNMITEQGEE